MFSRRFFKRAVILTVLLSAGLFFAHPIFAAPAIDQAAFKSFAANAGFATGSSITEIIARLIRTVIGFLGVITVVLILYGGFLYMTSGGETTRLEKAKKILKNAVIGLVIVLSAYTIAQFIVNTVSKSTSGDITQGCDPKDPSCVNNCSTNPSLPGCFPNKPAFYLAHPNTDCAPKLSNFQLQLVFSKSVKDTKNIFVTKKESDGTFKPVSGDFAVSGQQVTFTPKALCPDSLTLHCFDKGGGTYHVSLAKTLTTSSGASLTCPTSLVPPKPTDKGKPYPCDFDFTTGTAIDTEPPTEISIQDPKEGNHVITGISNAIQVKAVDDSGVSSVEFYAVDGTEPVDVSGTPTQTSILNGLTTEKFNGSWTPIGFSTNKSYPLWARGSDCAGNKTTSDKISVVLRASNCENKTLDAAKGETGTCEVEKSCDCGGDPKNEFYCGLCEPSPCTKNEQCSSGFCIISPGKTEGQCKKVPVIKSVSPDNGAAGNAVNGEKGNLITISGVGFGSVPGSVDFLGTEKNNTEKNAPAYLCPGKTSWSDKEIVVQIPDGAIDGPLRVNIPSVGAVPVQTDRTDDAFGPSMDKFDVNALKRPGLCSVVPAAENANAPFVLNGLGFGAVKGSSIIFLTNFEVKTTSWGNLLLKGTVPNVDSGDYLAQVFTGDYLCLDSNGAKTAVKCSLDLDCKNATPALSKCATNWCSENTSIYCDSDAKCQTKTVTPCTINANCNAANAEYCDVLAKLCVKDEGVCSDVRVGSNELKFNATHVVDVTKPTIFSINSGWSDCTGGAVPVCTEQKMWGPSGQYVTIRGSGFGSVLGKVNFKNNASGKILLGSTDFPAACGKSFWQDDSIVVKVPFDNTDPTINPLPPLNPKLPSEATYTVTVTKQSGSESDPFTDPSTKVVTPFSVLGASFKPTPGICSISPSVGPVNDATVPITIEGENIGGTSGTITFSSAKSVLPGSWKQESTGTNIGGHILVKSVPGDAGTGPVYITDSLSKKSNTLNFKVGNCKTDKTIVCKAGLVGGETCCTNGSCKANDDTGASTCDDKPKIAHLAYKFSTSPIPIAPKVIEDCAAINPNPPSPLPPPSPSPSMNWSKKGICVNAAVTASFNTGSKDRPMIASTLNADNIIVQICDTEDDKGVCTEKGWNATPLVGTFEIPVAATSFQWNPKEKFTPNKLYRVTIKGSSAPNGGVQAAATEKAGAASMIDDYPWIFRVSSSPDDCGVGSVNVSPTDYLATQPGKPIGYNAALISKTDQCVVLSCKGHQLEWSRTGNSANFLPGDTAQSKPAADICSASVDPIVDTEVGNPVHIIAAVKNESNNPEGFGLLNIQTTEPKITDRFPDCSAACPNTKPWVRFNVPMVENKFGVLNNGTVANPNFNTQPFAMVQLYKCSSPACSPLTETNVTKELVKSIEYKKVEANDSGDYRAYLNFNDNTHLELDTSYRIVLGSSFYQSIYYKTLFPKGSNYLTPLADPSNLFYPNTYSWKFRTKPSDQGCGVDHVEILPKDSVLTYVGAHQEFYGTAHSAPDTCSALGQALQDTATAWAPWKATDESTDKLKPSKTDTAFMLGLPPGEIKRSSDLPNFCSSSCLWSGTPSTVCGDSILNQNAGTKAGEACDHGVNNGKVGDTCSSSCLFVGTIAPICGNGTLDSGEECDDGNTNPNDGCSLSCLREGSKAYGSICGDGTVNQNAGTKAGESCDDGNVTDGDGCSGNCLQEASEAGIAGSSAACGNKVFDKGEDVGCDTAAGISEWCTNQCLFKGSSKKYVTPSTCGDNLIGTGEQCDDGNKKNGDGCSFVCLHEGSSSKYVTPSYCGDGLPLGIGEECEATVVDVAKAKVAGFGVAEIGTNAPKEVETTPGLSTTGYAISKVSASVPGQIKPAATSTLSLFCSCSSDVSCGDKPSTTKSLACGVSKCCYERPAEPTTKPIDGDSNKCRNTAVSVQFDQEMDAKSFGSSFDVDGDGKISETEFDPNIQIQLVTMKTDTNPKDGKITASDPDVAASKANCPYYEKAVGFGNAKNLFASIWNWVKTIFGQPALADATANCYLPVSYDQDPVTHNVYLRYTKALEPLAKYKLTVKTDPNGTDAIPKGVLSQNGVGICLGDISGACTSGSKVVTFTTGSDICLLDLVNVTDNGKVTKVANVVTPVKAPESKSPGYYSRSAEMHDFSAQSLSVRKDSGKTEEIQKIEGVYSWDWSWMPSAIDAATKLNILTIDPVQANTTQIAQYTAAAPAKNGDGDVIVTAKVNDNLTPPTRCKNDNTKICDTSALTFCKINKVKSCTSNADCGGVGDSCGLSCTTGNGDSCSAHPPTAVVGSVSETVFLCENPWPGYNQAPKYIVPYMDKADDGIPTNFSMFYCRDAGDAARCDAGDKAGLKCQTDSDCKKKKSNGTDGQCLPFKTDDLLELTLPPTISTPSSKNIHSDVLKEFVFNIAGTKDSIGVRVMRNPNYLSALAWFHQQGFTGSPQSVTLDGYDAVQTDTTTYAVAANVAPGGSGTDKVYSNVYAISYNGDAGIDAQGIFNLLLESFKLNAVDSDVNAMLIGGTKLTPVSHVGLCLKTDGGYAQNGDAFVSCSADSDCADICQPNGKCSVSQAVCSNDGECKFVAASCDANKQKLIRDMKRLTDVTEMVGTFEKYGATHGHCSATIGQTCVVYGNATVAPFQNPSCPEKETCVPGYPTVQSATFVPSMTNSLWPSWNSTLGNALGSALPSDPLNQFNKQCKNPTGDSLKDPGFDSTTCWNGKIGNFTCPMGSHIYGYKNQGGEDYVLSTELEYHGVAWNDPIDKSLKDHVTIQASYQIPPAGAVLTEGFTSGSQYCNAMLYGASSICGDGVKSTTTYNADGSLKQKAEECEKGETKAVSCDANVCIKGDFGKIGKECVNDVDCGTQGLCQYHSGNMNVACKSDCSDFQSLAEAHSAGAVCKPMLCGNGVKDSGEICDDGVLNGSYGHCALDCTLTKAVSCGDGTLAGTEECDCGNETNFQKVGTWSELNKTGICRVANGEYGKSGNTFFTSCSADCKATGPTCGDKSVNGSNTYPEACDGGSETYAGSFCKGGTLSCTADSDCGGDLNSCYQGKCDIQTKKCTTDADCGGTKSSCDINKACTTSQICISGTSVGSQCSKDSECQVGANPLDVCKPEVCSANKCSVSGNACKKNSDCSGKCSVSGVSCATTNDCAGKCSETPYNLTRNRVCINNDPPNVNACKWGASGSGWSNCEGGPQHCGNGVKEGTEECDDGNVSDNDSCLKTCKQNACGDNHVNVGIESCDAGPNNKDPNDPNRCANIPYGGSCNFCTNSCDYMTQTGPYCGDGKIDANEVCDGTAIPYFCVKKTGSQPLESQGVCDPKDEGKNGKQNYDVVTNGVTKSVMYDGCDAGSTCRKVGVCNGGQLQNENGKLCTYAEGNNINNCDGYCENSPGVAPTDIAKAQTCNWIGDCNNGVAPQTNEAALAACTKAGNCKKCIGAGACVFPSCAGNCGSTCPQAFQQVALQMQSNVEGSAPSNSVSLYSKDNGAQKTPDRAIVLVPACTVGVKLTASINTFAASASVSVTGTSKAEASVCGNGKVESGEECDDGNKAKGDGCDDVCKVETKDTDIILLVDLSDSMSKPSMFSISTPPQSQPENTESAMIKAQVFATAFVNDMANSIAGKDTKINIALMGFYGLDSSKSFIIKDLSTGTVKNPTFHNLKDKSGSLPAWIKNNFTVVDTGIRAYSSGIEAANKLLESQNNQNKKIVLLFSDGDPGGLRNSKSGYAWCHQDAVIGEPFIPAINAKYSIDNNSYEGNQVCTVEAREQIVDPKYNTSKATYYVVGLQTDATVFDLNNSRVYGYPLWISSMSSNKCSFSGEPNLSYGQNFVNGAYVYDTQSNYDESCETDNYFINAVHIKGDPDTQKINTLAQTLSNSIMELAPPVVISTSTSTQATTVSTGETVNIALPENFSCSNTSSTLPLFVTLPNQDTKFVVDIKNMTFTYCPVK